MTLNYVKSPLPVHKRRLTMEAFDALDPDVRRAVSEAAFRWTPALHHTAATIRHYDAVAVRVSNIDRGIEAPPPGYIDAASELRGIRRAPEPSRIPPARSLRKFQRGTINDI